MMVKEIITQDILTPTQLNGVREFVLEKVMILQVFIVFSLILRI